MLAGKARTCCSESNSMMAANSTSGATATWRTPAAYRFAPSTPTARPRCTRCCAARPATTSPPCARSSHAPAPARPAWTPTGDTAGPAGNRQQRPPLADLAGKRAARHEQLPLGRCCADPWSASLVRQSATGAYQRSRRLASPRNPRSSRLAAPTPPSPLHPRNWASAAIDWARGFGRWPSCEIESPIRGWLGRGLHAKAATAKTRAVRQLHDARPGLPRHADIIGDSAETARNAALYGSDCPDELSARTSSIRW